MQEHLPPLQSKVENVVLGQTTKWQGPPTKTADGRRIVVDAAILVIEGVITVATALWDGRDVIRTANNITIKQRSGSLNRWNLGGPESRVAAIKYAGIKKWKEHANVAVGAAQAVAMYARIPFRKEFTKRPRDFSIPADELESLTVQWGSLASMATGTTVLSANALTARWLYQYHVESNVEVKSVDLVSAQIFTSATQAQLSAQGAIHDLDIFKNGTTAGGGEDISAITNLAIPELGIEALKPLDFTTDYRAKRDLMPVAFAATPGAEQVLEPALEATQKALPVITSTPHTSAWDGQVVDKFRVNITGGTASCSAIVREVIEKPDAMLARAAQLYNIKPGTQLRMKTASKSRKNMGDGWDAREIRVATVSFGRIPGLKAA